jgi:hypothetical protein
VYDMKVIDGGSPALEVSIGEMTKRKLFWDRLKREVWHFRLKRWLPRLVWIDDEIDVRVTFKDIGALGGNPSRVWDASKLLYDMGIQFDAGSGHHGRDWEWDYSLSGPISVVFKGRAKHPEKRTLKVVQRPKIVA